MGNRINLIFSVVFLGLFTAGEITKKEPTLDTEVMVYSEPVYIVNKKQDLEALKLEIKNMIKELNYETN